MASYMGELRRLVGRRPLFSVGVSVVLQDTAGGLLLQRRSDSGLWGLPGGGAEPGETLETAAHRELWEETGLSGVALTPDFVISGPTFRHVYPHGDVVYLVGQAFRGQLGQEQFAGATLGVGGETLELGLFALDRLPALSGAIEREVVRRLSAERRMVVPHLPEPPTVPGEWGDDLPPLRALIGPRPLFSPGSSVICLDERERVLLLRAPGGPWTLPGGRLHLGETFGDAARRELWEETGLVAASWVPLHLYAGAGYRRTDPNGDVADPLALLYRARGLSGGHRLQRREAGGYGWFAPGGLPGELGGPLTRAMLRDALQPG